MKQSLSFVFVFLLLFVMLAPAALATEQALPGAASESSDSMMDSAHADFDTPACTASSSQAETTVGSNVPAATNGNADGAGAAEGDSSPGGFDDTGNVISYTIPQALTGSFEMVCGDTEFIQLHSTLEFINILGMAQKDGHSTPLALSVVWDFSTVDAKTPGGYTALGRIVLPEGAVLAEGLQDAVFIAVRVSDPACSVTPAAIVLTSFDEPYRTDTAAFAFGTSQEALAQWFSASAAGFSAYDADGNYYDLISGEWNLEAVNTASAGVYYAWTSPVLGTAYVLAEGVSPPRQLCAVSIQTPGEPDINCCVAGRGFLHFPWVLSATQEGQLDDFSVWLRQDGGEWTELSEGYLIVSDGLQLSQRIFTSGSTYALKVAYPGGETQVLTLQYDGELRILDYSGGDRDGGDTGGNKPPVVSQPAPTTPTAPGNTNGGDNNGDSSSSGNGASPPPVSTEPPSSPSGSDDADDVLPENEKPPASQNTVPSGPAQTAGAEKLADTTPDGPAQPTIPAIADIALHQIEATATDTAYTGFSGSKAHYETTPTAVPETPSEAEDVTNVYETYSPEKTVISGLRLRDLCADGESVVFGSGSLTVSIPSSWLSALNLSDSDTLTVLLTQPENGQLVFSVEAAGIAVTELPGTVIRLRWSPKSENVPVTVQNEAGEPVTDTVYAQGLLRFTAATAGTYTISEAAEEPSEKGGLSPLLPITGSLLLAAGGVKVFRRKCDG